MPRQVRRLSENVYEVGEKRVSVRCADGKVMVRVGGGYMPLYVLAPTLVAAGCGCLRAATSLTGCTGRPG